MKEKHGADGSMDSAGSTSAHFPRKGKDPEGASKGEATQIAICLRDWLAKHPDVQTIRQLSTRSRVPYSTLKKVAAAQHPPSRETLRKLVEYGGLACLRPWLGEPMPGVGLKGQREVPEALLEVPSRESLSREGSSRAAPEADTKTSGASRASRATAPDEPEPSSTPEPAEIDKSVRKMVDTFYSLKDQLELLKGNNTKGRELFRKYMSRRDAAYVLALLQALFSEDEFQRWILFTEYSPGGRRP